MALTPEFISAVSSRNLLRVRIMLKDSLLVDKKFYKFNAMIKYAEERSLNFWMENTEKLEIAPKDKWNVDLMNLELTRLVNDFTKERLNYCQRLIEKVYGLTLNTLPNSATQSQTTLTQKPSGYQQYPKSVNGNNTYYNIIIKGAYDINKILHDNKSPEGNRTWSYSDIDEILAIAKNISAACENIKSRRK